MIATDPFAIDHEFDVRGPEHPVALLNGQGPNQRWLITRPMVQPITITHIYPTHGQFADYETADPFPQYLQQDHPGRSLNG